MDSIIIEKREGYCIIRINRAKSHNSISTGTASDMLAALDSLKDEKAVIFTGEGRDFAAGYDLDEIARMDEKAASLFYDTFTRLLQKISSMDRLTLCAIKGLCFSAGLEIAACCDMRIASPDSLFGMPDIKLGMIPTGEGMRSLTRIAGEASLKELLFTCEIFYADKARAMGLAGRIEKEPLSAAVKIAEGFSGLNHAAFRKARSFFADGRSDPGKDWKERYLECFSSGDARAGIAQFMKRK